MAEDIRSKGFDSGLIISNNRFLAGNMHLQFPTSPAFVPDYHFEDLPSTQGFTSGIVIWDADRYPVIPEELPTFLKEKYQIIASEQHISYYKHTYKFGRTEQVTLAVMPIALSKE